MPRFLTVLPLLALLGGCVHRDESALSWHFLQTPEEGAKLAYGAPQSDDVALMMTCDPGSARVTLTMAAARPMKVIRLGADRFAARTEPDAMGGYLAEAQARTASPSMRAFAETGALELRDGGRRIDLAATPADRAGVRRFFEACRA